MSKMKAVVLLVTLNTVRPIEGTDASQKVSFGPGTGRAVKLTEEEIAVLDRMEKATGRKQYRLPKDESLPIESEPDETEPNELPAYDDITVKQLKARLDAASIEYDSDDKKTLYELAGGEQTDPDAGL